MQRDRWLAVLVLLITVAFRLNAVTYGLDNVCLTVPEEYWLYDTYQPVSLYAWNVAPSGASPNLPGRVQLTPLVTTETSALERLYSRLIGCAAGLLTAALLMCMGRKLRARWWWLAGLLVAVSPWFVGIDLWMVRFDTAPLVIAIGALALWESRRLEAGWQHTLVTCIYSIAAVSLLLIAPPLWWLAVIMLLLHPHPLWRWTLFILFVGIALIPGLQTPELWLAAAQLWDGGTTASCILVGLALALWWRRSLSTLQMRVLFAVVVFTGGITLYQDAQLKQPSASEWELIHWLQTRIPDDSVVQFDFATWSLGHIVACPMGADIHFQPQSLAVKFFDTRNLVDPYYYVSTDLKAVENMPYFSQIADQYWVGRGLELANPVDIGFGDLVHLLSYEVLTPTANPSDVADIRIDYQFGANITPDVLAYAAYVHLTPKNDPTKNWVNYTDRFFEESGNTGSRRVMLNHHLRFALPPGIPTGSYDVRFGIFDTYTGKRAGDEIVLGEILVQ